MIVEEFESGMTDGLKRQRVLVKLYQFHYQYFNAYTRDFFKKSSQKSLEVKKKAVLLHPQIERFNAVNGTVAQLV